MCTMVLCFCAMMIGCAPLLDAVGSGDAGSHMPRDVYTCEASEAVRLPQGVPVEVVVSGNGRAPACMSDGDGWAWIEVVPEVEGMIEVEVGGDNSMVMIDPDTCDPVGLCPLSEGSLRHAIDRPVHIGIGDVRGEVTVRLALIGR